MAFDSKVFLDYPDETTTEQPAAIGEMREFLHATLGKQTYRMIRNTSGASIAAGLVVSFASGSSLNVALAAAADPILRIAGATVVAIPDDSYGWVVCGGQVAITSEAAFAVNTPLSVTGTDGKVDDTAVTGIEHALIGLGLTLAAGADVSVTVRLSGLI